MRLKLPIKIIIKTSDFYVVIILIVCLPVCFITCSGLPNHPCLPRVIAFGMSPILADTCRQPFLLRLSIIWVSQINDQINNFSTGNAVKCRKYLHYL